MPPMQSKTSSHRKVVPIVDSSDIKAVQNDHGRYDAGSTMSSSFSSHSGSYCSELNLNHEIESPCSRLLEMKHCRRWELHDSILDTIGQTPIVQLQRMAPKGIDIFVKVESSNPGGSLKDRSAIGMIEWAEKTGKLQPGQTVIEASSGNAGIGYALVCAVKGYPFVCVMSESYSVERRKLMRFLGAKVILTKAQHMATGMLVKAQELADEHGYFYPKQFDNEANAWIHEQTTGDEICRAFAKSGRLLDHFFMSYGTGGTVLGISRAFRRAKMATKIHLCEPSNAPMLKSGIATKYPKEGKGPCTSFASAHPMWSPHHLQGWATDFIPKLVAQIQAENGYDNLAHVSSGAAIECSKQLAKTEGIFTGISGGGILAAALTFAETCEPGTTILCILPDTGERYLSTILFDDIPDEMTPEEKELSATTPGHAPPTPPMMHGILPADTDQLFDL